MTKAGKGARVTIADPAGEASNVAFEALTGAKQFAPDGTVDDPRLAHYGKGRYTAENIAEAVGRIARGEIVAAIFRQAVPAGVCQYAAVRLDAYANKQRYHGVQGVGRIGTSLYEVQFSRQQRVDYFRSSGADLAVSRSMFPPGKYPLDYVRLALDDRWPGKVGRLRLEEGLCGLGLLRFLDDGGEILPHNDKAAADVADSALAQAIDTQIAFNLLVQNAERGGITRVYPRRLSRNEYDANRRPVPDDFALREECLPLNPVVIRPQAGDVYLFDADFPHRVSSCSGLLPRYTLSAFIGVLRNSDLVIFS